METNLASDNHFEDVRFDYAISILNVGFYDKESFSSNMETNSASDNYFEDVGYDYVISNLNVVSYARGVRFKSCGSAFFRKKCFEIVREAIRN